MKRLPEDGMGGNSVYSRAEQTVCPLSNSFRSTLPTGVDRLSDLGHELRDPELRGLVGTEASLRDPELSADFDERYSAAGVATKEPPPNAVWWVCARVGAAPVLCQKPQ